MIQLKRFKAMSTERVDKQRNQLITMISFVLILTLAVILRFVGLEIKSPHFDEGVNGHFVEQIFKQGFFQYDPTNFHGPLYFYLLQIAEVLFGHGIFGFRFLTAVIGTATVMLAFATRRWLGVASIWAAAALAVSPGFVFYNRYAIHESLLIFSQMLMIYGFLSWRLDASPRGLRLLMIGIVVSLATKETFFIFIGTALIASVCVELQNRVFQRRFSGAAQCRDLPGCTQSPPVFGAISVLVAIATVVVLYTGFFQDPDGAIDFFRAFLFWKKTGLESAGHDKPFYYWLELFARYEWPSLIAFVSTPVLVFSRSLLVRHLAWISFGVTLAYSLIPYKTPWCVIGLILPLAFVFGELASRWRNVLVSGLALLLLVASTLQAYRLNFIEFENPNEAYVYVQSTSDVSRLDSVLRSRVNAHPSELQMEIQVFLPDPWPLPWLLRLYPQASFRNWRDSADQPEMRMGDVVLIERRLAEVVESRLEFDYIRTDFLLRDSYGPGYAYFKAEKFSEWVKGALIPRSNPGAAPQ